jgi:hypothetical protein
LSLRWLFYIEGTLTVFVASVAIFVLPDFPDNTRFLTPQERLLAIWRMKEDTDDHSNNRNLDYEPETSKLALSGLQLAIKDPKVWWLGLMLTSQAVALSFQQYLPTLTATLGYEVRL